ncbi:MAG: hypothetical protein IT239_01825 [Bacteroidia bacterium]|nr:hypothetical protein [Bacteroidia bacterium]
MDVLLEILKFIIPSGITFATAYFIIKRFLDNESRKTLLELKQANNSEVIKLRIQAFERTMLLLERISPYSLIPRVHKNGMSAIYFQTELLHQIRSEFEHNLTMQLYLSHGAWELVKSAKEETIKIINIAASRTNEASTSADLAKNIYDIMGQIEKVPSQIAIDYLKKEFQSKFD